MWKFIVRRLFVTFPQIVILSVIIFILAQMMPGDALTGLIDPNIDPAAIEEQRERLG
ncbi:ABC transporter permease, partial [Oceanobacillus profundus]|nr:ABC transporter permease [Oceanobacillus profundus]